MFKGAAFDMQFLNLKTKANVQAFAIFDGDGDHVGTVRFIPPQDGASRLTCAAADWSSAGDGDEHEKWTRWQLGWGGGHDKRTAAMAGMTIGGIKIHHEGERWDRQLRAAGYVVTASTPRGAAMNRPVRRPARR